MPEHLVASRMVGWTPADIMNTKTRTPPHLRDIDDAGPQRQRPAGVHAQTAGSTLSIGTILAAMDSSLS